MQRETDDADHTFDRADALSATPDMNEPQKPPQKPTQKPAENSAPSSAPELQLLARSILADSPILEPKICSACQIPSEQVPELLTEVLRFMYLIAVSKRRLTPSLTVDLAWHELILCTKLYQQLCTTQFGRFIHHHPGGGEEESQQQFRQTIKLYNLRFGAANPAYWGQSGFYGVEADCGTCEATA